MNRKRNFKKLIFENILWRGLYFLTLFLINVIISRYFKASGSGWIYYISNYFSFALLIGSFSMETGLAYYGARKDISFHKLSTFSLLWSLAVGSVIVGITGLLYRDYDMFSFGQIVLFSIAYIPGVLLTTFYSPLFFARQDFFTPNIILIATNGMLILFLVLSMVFEYTPAVIISGYFITFLVQGLSLAVSFNLNKAFRLKISFPTRKEFEKIIVFSWPAFLGNVIYFLLRRVDYFFINNICEVCGPDDLGNYIQVSKIVQLFLLVPSILATSIFPITAAGRESDVAMNLQKLTRILFSLTAVACIGLAGIGYWLFPLLFGASFHLMFLPFLIIIPGILALSCIYPLVAFFSGKNMLFINIKALTIAVTIMITGDVLLIPVWGINGAAAVSSLSYVIYYAYMLKAFSVKYNLSLSHLFLISASDIRALFKYDQNK